MVKFTLFGIPVTIHPWFWVTCAALGGALQAKSQQQFLAAAVFVLVAFISVLVHELGHALVGRRLGGGYATIELVPMGGLAYNHGGRFTRWSRFWMIAAGPGAGFILGFATLVGIGLVFGDQDAVAMFKLHVFSFGSRPELSDRALDLFIDRPMIGFLIGSMLWVNFWWGFINLLPVLPLDGGKISELWVKPQRLVYQIGIGTAGAVCLYGLLHSDWYIAAMFGYFAYTNYQSLTTNRWR